MSDWRQRLLAHPWLTLQLLLASLFIALLALASPLYIIQVLNRYLSYGIDATLITLTVGVILAILMEQLFRRIRHSLAQESGHEPSRELLQRLMATLQQSRHSDLQQLLRQQSLPPLQLLEQLESYYSATHLTTLIDIPFSLLFIAVLALLSPLLALIALLFLAGIFLYALLSHRRLKTGQQQLQQATQQLNLLLTETTDKGDLVQLFDQGGLMVNRWQEQGEVWLQQRERLEREQSRLQAMTASLQALMAVVIYATGARLALAGEITLGVLIGANILAARALQPLIRFAQMGEGVAKAAEARRHLQQWLALPAERQQQGSVKSQFNGQIALQDIGFSYPNRANWLFEGLHLTLKSGEVAVVSGESGSGKSTLARLLAGLLLPQRGSILADGVDLRQLQPKWWRGQISYLPQQAELLQLTLRQTLTCANPQLQLEQIEQLLRQCDLLKWVEHHPDGLDLKVDATLSLGQRRRIALARALAVGGKLVILDEPAEGLDSHSRRMIYQLLLQLSQQQVTLVICSDDPLLQQSANVLIDLTPKPTPLITVNPGKRGPAR
ncbi:ATP-binding cassette domain-containing protein [Ectothiorhodospiraceae bacterium BW-2]|nr:ATP-binding cassette domain-containing protein [Ectothiorhodospiraceae bacterium BW-2]